MFRLSGWMKVQIIFFFSVVAAFAAHAQIFKTLLEFDELNGSAFPTSPLVQGPDGNLYGISGGVTGFGTIFMINRSGKVTTLYTFCTQENCPDGYLPNGPLTLASDGNFYGTTYEGGDNNRGTVFKVTRAGQLTTIHTFNCQDDCEGGIGPLGSLVQGTDGNLYGVTVGGGYAKNGTVFKISTDGDFTTLHRFNGQDGSQPVAGLIQAADGNFYGTTEFGGADGGMGCGNVFRITRNGRLTSVYKFCSQENDGTAPTSRLVQAIDGNLYGTTYIGGAHGFGTIYKITPTGLTTLFSFDASSGSADTDLIQATDGNLYGTTLGGDPSCKPWACGTLFRARLDGTFTTLHSFSSPDGAWPSRALLQATNGVLYGTTEAGGENLDCGISDIGCGTVFSLNVGLGPYVTFVRGAGKVGQTGGILGQGFTGTTSVMLNGTPAPFKVVSDTYLTATVPAGATSGYVTVTTPSGTLTSNKPFRVIP